MKVELFKVVSIGKLKASELPDRSKVFAKLVLEGQINSVLRFLSETTSGGVRSLTDEVLSQLKQKHPLRGGSRGRVQGVSGGGPPPPGMTCGFLTQVVFCKKNVVYWC